MAKLLVTRELLDLYDRYDGDFGLLDERWASKGDRDIFSTDQFRTLGEYVDQLNLVQSGTLSADFMTRVVENIARLESLIEPEVIAILRDRIR